MTHEQLERCYKTVMEQRNQLHEQLVDANQEINCLQDEVNILKQCLNALSLKHTRKI